MSTIVRTEQLTKDFPVGFWRSRPKRALDALSIEIQSGEVFGLLGPNGAGKSTTLKLLVRLLWPTSGRAELFGRPIDDFAARARMGFLPENPTFYDHLTGEELVGYFGALYGHRGGDLERRVARLLDDVGIDEARRRPLRTYSKGMVQRVGLAQALVGDPELVILDEPMSGLDPLGRKDVRELILRLRDAGRTVLFSSHILSDAELLCSRVAILAKGRLAAEGRLTDLLSAGHRGWEIVVDAAESIVEGFRSRVRRVTAISVGRAALEIAADARPEPLIAELVATGASLVSVTPLRATLEDVFVAHVGSGRGPA